MQRRFRSRLWPCGLGCALVALAVATPARAEPAPQGLLNLSASAEVEVTKDLLSVALGATRDGPDAAGVQAGLKQAIDAALAEARKAARPGQLEVHTGNFSLYPRYNGKGRIDGWQGSAELLIEGRDMPAIAQLTGRLSTVAITRVSYSLSREARAKVEGEVTAQAIARYRAKAAEMAKQFGYGAVTIREVNVATNDSSPGGPVPMLMRAKAEMATDQALPVEPGRGIVSATVSGSVQMQ